MNARDHLRQATQASHRSLESLPLLNRLMSPAVDLDTIHQVLVRLLIAHKSLRNALAAEPWHMEVPTQHIDDALLRLEQDVKSIGGNLSAPATRNMPIWSGQAAAIGVLYVIEGSQLGRVAIGVHLRQMLGKGTNLTYFNAAPDNTAQAWEQFSDWLDITLRSEAEIETSIEAALDYFAWLHDLFGSEV